jgi:uncharacterized protein (DUF2235 family)
MKIVVFSDGTGNSSAKLFRTNVWRLYEALDLCDNGKQVAFYDNGVGTASLKLLGVLGGAFGFGLKRNVRDIYMFICRNYDPKTGPHQLYAFGFSRGAFTIRVLLGLIRRQGLVPYHDDDRELQRLATWAYREYRSQATRETFSSATVWLRPWFWFRVLRDIGLRVFDVLRGAKRYDSSKNIKDARFAFVGLWDTVAAYGSPIVEMTRGWDRWVWPLSLPTRDLSAHVDKACHALALDDERQTFHPLLWDEKKEERVWRGPGTKTADGVDVQTIADERLSQVWFAGMHSNVGGGYPDDGMAYEPLCWIAEHAERQGMLLKDEELDKWRKRRTPSAPMSDSRSGLGSYYRYLPRLVASLSKDWVHGVQIDRPKIHSSVLRRIKSGIDGYAPIVLPGDYAVTDGQNIFELPATALGQEFVVESAAEAKARSEQQEQAWDSVWYRRIAYFLTVLVTVLIVLLAFMADEVNEKVLPGTFPTLAGTIELLAGMLPDIAAPVLEHFKNYPLQLVVGGFLAVGLMGFSSWIQRRYNDLMRKIWNHDPVPERSIWLRLARVVRRSGPYKWALDRLRYFLAPHFFGLSTLALLVAAAFVTVIRLSFDAPMVFGQICKDLPETQLRPIADAVAGHPEQGTLLNQFVLSDPCHPMGVWLKARETYVLSVVPYNSAKPRRLDWNDNTIPVTDLKGFTAQRFTKPEERSNRQWWVFNLAIPIRRHKVLDWYVPMGRVGAYADQYFPITSWDTELKPRTEGQLFLYVNDALPIPRVYDFYSNNNTCTKGEIAAGALEKGMPCTTRPRESWYIARKVEE